MKIVITHLFPDVLNLYGENGNVTALKHALESQNVETEVKSFTYGDSAETLSEADMIYVGSGTEAAFKKAAAYLYDYRDTVKTLIEEGKFFLATGNSLELFGERIKNSSAEAKTLGAVPFYTERMKERVVGECVFTNSETNTEIIGFFNHQGRTEEPPEWLFSINRGIIQGEEKEGVKYKNFAGTYLIGPLLVRNPELLQILCKKLILSRDESFKFLPFDFELERKAHDVFLKKYEQK